MTLFLDDARADVRDRLGAENYGYLRGLAQQYRDALLMFEEELRREGIGPQA